MKTFLLTIKFMLTVTLTIIAIILLGVIVRFWSDNSTFIVVTVKIVFLLTGTLTTFLLAMIFQGESKPGKAKRRKRNGKKNYEEI